MQVRTLPAALDWTPLRWAALLVFAIAAVWNAQQIAWLADYWLAADFEMWDYGVILRASQYPLPYDQQWYVWSPLAVWPVRVLALIGPVGWIALHFLALIPLGWTLRALVLLSWPFWFDVVGGNVMIFVAVVGFLALRGNRYAMVGFFVMTLLMPRPLMVPLVVWMLWREPWTRSWFAGLFVVHGIAVLVSGLGTAWVQAVLAIEGIESPWNLSPSRWIGYWWLIAAIPLAGWLTYRGRLGLASVAFQPYVWPQYLLMLVLEARPARR